MSEQQPKPYLSTSRMNSYMRCPEAFRRRYLENEKIPPAVAMAKGSSVHKCAETNFRQKIDSHVDLPVKDIVDAAAADFEERSSGDLFLTAEEASRGKNVVVSEALDSVVTMAEVHAKEQAPEYQPIFVEQQAEIELPDSPVNLLGVLDLADDQRRVVDLKTANRKKPDDEAETNLQLTVYAAAYHALTGEPSVEQRLDAIVETKTKVYRQVLATQREPADYRALAARINAIQKAIDAGSFPPTSPDSWVCSERFCGYARDCIYYQGIRERRRHAQND